MGTLLILENIWLKNVVVKSNLALCGPHKNVCERAYLASYSGTSVLERDQFEELTAVREKILLHRVVTTSRFYPWFFVSVVRFQIGSKEWPPQKCAVSGQKGVKFNKTSD